MKLRAEHALITVLVIYLAIAVAYAVRLPDAAGPDETEHNEYIRILRDYHRMPLLPGYAPEGLKHLEAQQAQHPPLYYAVLAVLSLPVGDLSSPTGWLALRLISIVLAATALVITFMAARVLWPEGWGPAAALVMALIPQFQYLTAVLNNSTGEILAGAVYLYLVALVLRGDSDRPRDWWLLGLTTAVALMVKVTTAWVVVGVVACVLIRRRRESHTPGWTLRRLAAGLLPAAVVMGIWCGRSMLLYSTLLPAAVTTRPLVVTGLIGCIVLPDVGIYIFAQSTLNAITSFPFPFWLARPYLWHNWMIVVPFMIVAGLSVIGYIRTRRRLKRGWEDPQAWHLDVGRVGLLGFILGILTAMMINIKDVNTLLYGGRYMLSLLPICGVAWAVGAMRVSEKPRVRWLAIGLVFLGLLAACIYSHWWIVAFHTGALGPAPAPTALGASGR